MGEFGATPILGYSLGMNRIESLQKLLLNSPADAQLHYFLATELFHAKRYAEAIVAARRYLELAPDDQGAAFRILGNSLFETGDREGAKAALEKGIAQAMRHGHPSMAGEFRDLLEEWGA
jgi:Flp pilus assembly protein TadD